jgi:hypothetical protein
MNARIACGLMLLLGLLGKSVSGQKRLPAQLDSLSGLMKTLTESQNVNQRAEANANFIRLLVQTLKEEGDTLYYLDTLRPMSVLQSPDKLFRILTWQVKMEEGTVRHYGCIIRKSNKARPIVPLFDNSDQLGANEDTALGIMNWLGCQYYDIIQTGKGDKAIYTLIGHDTFEPFSQRKIIETLTFNAQGRAIFGLPLFEDKPTGKLMKRKILEYSKQAVMMLRFVKDKKMIVMDHLIPSNPKNKDMRVDYVPDLSYDAYVWKKNKWVFQSNVNLRNDPDGKTYLAPEQPPVIKK